MFCSGTKKQKRKIETMSNGETNKLVAKDLISMVVAQVRKGAPKTKKINKAKKKTEIKPVELVDVVDGAAEVTEQLRKFENMLVIQRLDSLLDMQKMQWARMDRIVGLLETLTMLTADHPQQDSVENDDDLVSTTAALDELIDANKNSTNPSETAKEELAAKDVETYENAESYAHKICKVRNDIN